MTSLGFALLLGSVHASVVGVVTVLARRCLPARMAAGRVTIGAVGMGCVLLVTGLALLPLPGLWPGEVSNVRPKVAPARLAPITEESPNELHDSPSALSLASTEVAADRDAILELPVAWLHRLQRTAEQSAPRSRVWRNAVVAILLTGSTIGLLRLWFAMRSVARLRRSSLLVTSDTVVAIVNRLTERCDCRRTIEVRESAHLASAAASGWSRPVILLPSDWPQWSPEELTSVLAHEVAHVHRADYARRVVAFTSVAVHFYHPLLRVIARRLAADQEFAADQLARSLVEDAPSYTRGLARLALRYHESLSDRHGWSSVSIMPRSSDFLARRLEMLRVKDLVPGRPTTTIASYALPGSVVALALATAFLRGAAAADDSPKTTSSAPIAETARLPAERDTSTTTAGTPAAEQALFSRADFNPATIGLGASGGFVIRVGDLLRHPEIQPHVDAINEGLKNLLHEIIGDSAKTFDVREIEWIAGDLLIQNLPSRDPMQNGQLTLGSGRIVIRTAHAANWRQILLDEMPGSTLEHFDGRPYVQIPVLPAMGPVPVRMRSPDPWTLIYRVGTKPDPKGKEAEEKFLRAFFDDTPSACPWAGAWRAVDGGLVTVAFDNSAIGWPELAAASEDYPELITPLARKTKFVAFGGDWTEVGNRTGLRLRATCEDRESVREIHLASMTLLSFWPGLVLDWGDAMSPYQRRILQFFSSVKVQPSAAGAAEHFVHGTAEVAWDPQEFAKVLGLTGNWFLPTAD